MGGCSAMAAREFIDFGGGAVDDIADLIAPHPDLSALFTLWERARGGRAMPSRRDFTPECLRPWLGNLALIDVSHDPLRLHYRLVGIHIVENLKSDPTGKDFDDVVADPASNPATRGPYRCLMLREPVFEIVRPPARGFFAFDYARLSLPLSQDGRTINMILVGEYVIAQPGDLPSVAARPVAVAKVLN